MTHRLGIAGVRHPRRPCVGTDPPHMMTVWELSDAEWLKVMRRPDYVPRAIRKETVAQPTLFALEVG